MDRPLPESVFDNTEHLKPEDFPNYQRFQEVYLAELEAMPEEVLPELPDEAYGDDAVVLEEYEDDRYLD